jgi:hypothetical protein
VDDVANLWTSSSLPPSLPPCSCSSVVIVELSENILCGALALLHLGAHISHVFRVDGSSDACTVNTNNFPESTSLGQLKRVAAHDIEAICAMFRDALFVVLFDLEPVAAPDDSFTDASEYQLCVTSVAGFFLDFAAERTVCLANSVSCSGAVVDVSKIFTSPPIELCASLLAPVVWKRFWWIRAGPMAFCQAYGNHTDEGSLRVTSVAYNRLEV